MSRFAFSFVLLLSLAGVALAQTPNSEADKPAEKPEPSAETSPGDTLYNAVEGKSATMVVSIGGGTPPFTFQWRKNGATISGATDVVLALAPLSLGDSGDYTVTVTNAQGSETSPPATLLVRPARPSRLSNVSVLAAVEPALIVGFALSGNDTEAPASILARAAGPALAQFGVVGPIADPTLQIFAGSDRIASNDDWETNDRLLANSAAQVGAFPFPPASKDAAVMLELPPANYSAHATDKNTVPGVGSIELYELNASTAPKRPQLINVSARAMIGKGRATLVAGFTIEGEAPLTVLIRGVGPGLSHFGVDGVLQRPRLTLFQGRHAIASNEGWTARDPSLTQIAAKSVAAFALSTELQDAALVRTLPPGSYTVEISSADDSSGVALVEVYDVR